MLTGNKLGRFSIVVAAALFCASAARAATYTWDSSGMANSPGGVTDGPGTWSTSNINWWNTSPDVAWPSSGTNTAVFGVGAAAQNPFTVNVSGSVTAGGVDFNNQLYTLSGGTLTMNNGASTYTAPDFSIAPGVTGTLNNLTYTKTTWTTFVSGGGTLALTGGSATIGSSSSSLYIDGATFQVGAGETVNLSKAQYGIVLGSYLPNSNYVQTGGSVTNTSTYVGNLAIGAPSSFSLSGGTFINTSTFNLGQKANSTLNLSGGSLYVGGVLASGSASGVTATINLSGPGVFDMNTTSNLGYANSARGILNMSGGTAIVNSNYLALAGNAAAATGIVNQSAGLMNAIAVEVGLNYNGTGYAYGGYLLSGGTLNLGGASVGNQYHSMGLFSQTGGVVNDAGNLLTGYAATGGGQGVVDISVGSLTHTTGGSVMDTGGYGTGTPGYGVLTVRNSGYFQEQTGNFVLTNCASATGIVNVVSGGTLEASRIYTSAGSSTINFDGGTLRAYNSANAANFLNGLSNAVVYPGGLTFDTNGQNVTIGQQLSAPAGYGVGATDSMINVTAGSGGSGYLAPPVVTFSAPASGVPATGVAVLSGSAVTGVIITSPGSGYTSGQAVTVTFNGNSNASYLATTMAGSFTVNANTLLSSSGGLTVIGGGALTLTASNTYTGNTNVSNGALYLNGQDMSTSISVSGGATLGGSGSTTANVTVASGGTLDFSRNTGQFTAGNLAFLGSATINFGALSNSTTNLSVGVLTPSATAHLIDINANLGLLSVSSGTYDIINYDSAGGALTSSFTLSSVAGLSNRQHASLLNQSNQIDIVVTGTTPYWNGNQPDWVSANAFTLQPGNTFGTFQTGDNDIFDDGANGSTYAGTVLLSTSNVAPSAVTFNNTNLAYTLSGNYGITGSAALALTGSGSVTIANSNGYTGTTTIGPYATLQIGAGGASGALSPSPSAAIVDNGTLVFSRSDNIVQGTQFSSAGITGGGGLTQLGPGMVTLTASNTYSGPTTISNGTLQLGTGAANQDGSISGVGGVTDNGTLIYNLAGSQTVGYSIGGSGVLLKSGTGTLVLSNTNSYTGTTVNAGTLQLNRAAILVTGGAVGALPPGALVTVNSGATLLVGVADGLGYWAGSSSTIGLIGGTMTISPTGIHTNVGYLSMTAGTLTSLGAGDVYGNYIFNAGLTTNASAVPSVINANAIDLRGPGNAGLGGPVTFNVARGSGPVDLIVSSNVYGVGSTSGLDMAGPGIMWLTGSNTYTGYTEIDSGTLQVGIGGATGTLPVASPIYDYATLAFSRSDNIVQGLQFSGTISGNGGLTQLGPGMLTLNASNSYTGPTVISGGVVNATNFANEGSPSAIGAGSGSPSPADLVIDGGTLQYTGAIAQNSNWLFTVGPSGRAALDASGAAGSGTLTLGSGGGGAIGFANSGAPATLTLTGSGAGVLSANISDSGTAPNVTSLVKMGAGTWNLNGANSYSGTTTISSGTLIIAGANAGTGPLNVNAGALYITGSAAATSISVAGAATLGGTGSAPSAGANVANGGILDLSQNAGNTFSLGGLTFAGHATINVDALANYTGNPVLSTGPLATSSTASLVAIDANLGAATVTSGTYDLISYTGSSIGGAGLSGFTIALNGITSRQHASLVSVSNQIDVVVTGAIPYWNGKQRDWLSAGAFTLQPGGGTTSYQAGDTDIFDDSAMGSTYGGTVLVNSGNVAPSSVLFYNNQLSYTVSGAYGITGSAALALTGSGSVTIANSNGYTGTTTIGPYATLQIGAGGASGALSPSPSAAIVDNGMLAFSRSNNIVQGTQFSSAGITGSGSLTQLGPGMVTLTASNTYAGNTTISQGTLQLGAAGAIPGGAGAGNVVFSSAGNSAVLDLNGNNLSIPGLSQPNASTTNLVVNNSAGTATLTVGGNNAATTFAGVLRDNTGSGGVLALQVAAGGGLALAGSNSYSGGTTLSGGTLAINNNAALGSGALTITSGSLDNTSGSPVTLGNIPQNWNGNFTFLGSNNLNLGNGPVVSGVVPPTVTANAGTLEIDGPINANAQTMAFYGAGTTVLGGSVGNVGAGNVYLGNVVIAGTFSSNTVTFTGYNNGVNGTTTIPAGGLLVAPSASPAILPVSGTLLVSGGTVSNPSASDVDVGIGWTAGMNGILTINSGLVDLTGGYINFGHAVAGVLNLNGGQLNLSQQCTLTSRAGQAWNFNGGTLKLTGNLGNLFSAPNDITTYVGDGGAIIDLNGHTATISNDLSATGSGGLTVNASNPGGVLTLSGNNNFIGGLTINAGAAVAFTNDNQLGVTGGSITLNDGCLKGGSSANISLSADRTITLTGNRGYFSAGFNGTITIDSQLTGPGSLGLNYDASGTYVLTNSGNNYTGDTDIGTQGPVYYSSAAAAANLEVGAANALPYGPGMGNVVVGYVASPSSTAAACKATLDLNGFSANINGLTTNLTGSNAAFAFVDNSSATSGTLTLGNGDASATYDGTIENTGAGGLAIWKTGAGTQVLSGTGSYTGGTFVTDGELVLTSPAAIEDEGNLYVGNGLSAFGGVISADATSPAGQASALPANAAVPEPGTLVLAVALFGCAGLYRRLRRR